MPDGVGWGGVGWGQRGGAKPQRAAAQPSPGGRARSDGAVLRAEAAGHGAVPASNLLPPPSPRPPSAAWQLARCTSRPLPGCWPASASTSSPSTSRVAGTSHQRSLKTRSSTPACPSLPTSGPASGRQRCSGRQTSTRATSWPGTPGRTSSTSERPGSRQQSVQPAAAMSSLRARARSAWPAQGAEDGRAWHGWACQLPASYLFRGAVFPLE